MNALAEQPAVAGIVKASRTYRDLVYLLYALIVLAVILLVRYGFPLLRAHLVSLPMMDLLVSLRTLLVVVLLSFTPAALYVIRVGSLILHHQCYPYPGRRVMFDTPVVSGAKAVKMGKGLVVLGVVFLVLMAFSVLHTLMIYTGWINDPKLRRFWGGSSAVVCAWAPPGVHA